MEYKFLILNEKNVAEACVTYYQQLFNPPSNYIEVEDTSMMWHKYENNKWSKEKFEPSSNLPLNEFEQLKENNKILTETVAKFAIDSKKKDIMATQLATTVAKMNIEINKMKEGK